LPRLFQIIWRIALATSCKTPSPLANITRALANG
jgi:hypothetical protein